MQRMVLEIWSDVVCPWCYIGKRRFERALTQFPHSDQVEVVWRSFQLDPEAPRQIAGNLTELLAQKFGISPVQVVTMNRQITDLAAQEGLAYQLEHAQPGNTFDAHRLIHLAAANDRQTAAKERLLRAYFCEGRSISDHATLMAIGSELGLSTDAVHAMLDGNAYGDAVRSDQQRAAKLGIRGVPFFVLDGRYGVSGAQTPEVLLNALQQVWATNSSAS